MEKKKKKGKKSLELVTAARKEGKEGGVHRRK